MHTCANDVIRLGIWLAWGRIAYIVVVHILECLMYISVHPHGHNVHQRWRKAMCWYSMLPLIMQPCQTHISCFIIMLHVSLEMTPTSADCSAAIYESVAMVAGAFRGANCIGADVVATRESLSAFVNICSGTISSINPESTFSPALHQTLLWK